MLTTPEDRQAIRQWEHRSRSGFADLDEIDSNTDAYREAAKHFLGVMNAAFVFVLFSKHPILAAWQVAYAIGLPVCEGLSMEERSAHIGYGRAGISRGAKEFQRGNGLPQSEAMRDSAGACANARARQLTA